MNWKYRKAQRGESTIPKTLIHRNRYSKVDALLALQIIQKIAEVYVTKETLAEFANTDRALSKSFMAKTKIVKSGSGLQPNIIICAFYFMGEGLLMPQNKIVACKMCKVDIQIGLVSQNYFDPIYLCYFCAADSCLKEYWQNQS